MSIIFAPLIRAFGSSGLPINHGSGAIVDGHSYFHLFIDQTGAVFTSGDAINHYGAGLPFDVNGRLVINNTDPVRVDQAIPFTASGAVSVAEEPAVLYSQGVGYTAEGAISSIGGLEFDMDWLVQDRVTYGDGLTPDFYGSADAGLAGTVAFGSLTPNNFDTWRVVRLGTVVGGGDLFRLTLENNDIGTQLEVHIDFDNNVMEGDLVFDFVTQEYQGVIPGIEAYLLSIINTTIPISAAFVGVGELGYLLNIEQRSIEGDGNADNRWGFSIADVGNGTVEFGSVTPGDIAANSINSIVCHDNFLVEVDIGGDGLAPTLQIYTSTGIGEQIFFDSTSGTYRNFDLNLYNFFVSNYGTSQRIGLEFSAVPAIPQWFILDRLNYGDGGSPDYNGYSQADEVGGTVAFGGLSPNVLDGLVIVSFVVAADDTTTISFADGDSGATDGVRVVIPQGGFDFTLNWDDISVYTAVIAGLYQYTVDNHGSSEGVALEFTGLPLIPVDENYDVPDNTYLEDVPGWTLESGTPQTIWIQSQTTTLVAPINSGDSNYKLASDPITLPLSFGGTIEEVSGDSDNQTVHLAVVRPNNDYFGWTSASGNILLVSSIGGIVATQYGGVFTAPVEVQIDVVAGGAYDVYVNGGLVTSRTTTFNFNDCYLGMYPNALDAVPFKYNSNFWADF